jgi:hypothetical protein
VSEGVGRVGCLSIQVDAQRATLAMQRAAMINELEDKKVSARDS